MQACKQTRPGSKNIARPGSTDALRHRQFMTLNVPRLPAVSNLREVRFRVVFGEFKVWYHHFLE